MFTVLSLGFDKRTAVPSDHQHTDQANILQLSINLQAAILCAHQCHLLLLLSLKADIMQDAVKNEMRECESCLSTFESGSD